MAFQPKTEPGSSPRSIPTTSKKDYGEMSISELVSVLRIAYQIENFDDIEQELLKREAKFRAENGSLREKIEVERLNRIEVEERLKMREVQCEKGKRAQENYEQLLKEVKTRGLVEKHAIEELRKKNVALEREVCELKEFKKKMLHDVKSMAELREKISVMKEEKVGEKNALQRNEDTHYSVDTGTAQSPQKGNKDDAVSALEQKKEQTDAGKKDAGVKFKLEKEIVDLSDEDDDDDKYTSQGLHGEKAISQIIEENEHPQRVEMIKRKGKGASDIQASTSTSTSSADLSEKENLPVQRRNQADRVERVNGHEDEVKHGSKWRMVYVRKKRRGNDVG